MSRRRMMMLQQSNGFELVYDATSGELPKASDGWDLIVNENATATINNGYLRIASKDGTHVSRSIELTINKKQNLNKSKTVEVQLGDILNSTISFEVENYRYFVERYPDNLVRVLKPIGDSWVNMYTTTQYDVRYKKLKIVYDANTKETIFYVGDSKLYSTYEATPIGFYLYVNAEKSLDIASITYKEW